MTGKAFVVENVVVVVVVVAAAAAAAAEYTRLEDAFVHCTVEVAFDIIVPNYAHVPFVAGTDNDVVLAVVVRGDSDPTKPNYSDDYPGV